MDIDNTREPKPQQKICPSIANASTIAHAKQKLIQIFQNNIFIPLQC